MRGSTMCTPVSCVPPVRHHCHGQCALQAQEFLTRQDWTIARDELQAYYNKDAPVHQRRCVIPTQVPSPCPLLSSVTRLNTPFLLSCRLSRSLLPLNTNHMSKSEVHFFIHGAHACKHSMVACTWQLGTVRAADPGIIEHVRLLGRSGQLS